MATWRNTTLGEFVGLQRGHDLTESDRRPGRIPVMGSAGLNGYHDIPKAKGPGVVIGRSGASFGRVHYCSSDYWPHNTALYVTDFRGNDERFVYYFLGSIDFSRYNSGSAQASLNRNFIYPIPIRVPDVRGQSQIASVLSVLDDKIELNQRMNETLEALAQTLFKRWFVDPAADKLPNGWREGSILEVARLLSGGTPKTSRTDYWDGNILWASAKDVSQCGQSFLIATERTITEKGLKESATQMIPVLCTVVVARGATTGRMVLFGRDMAMNQTCYALSSTTETPFALYCLLRHEIEDLVNAAHGSVFDTITTSTFTGAKLTLPPVRRLKEFEEIVSSLFHRILSSTEESQTLAELRDALLPELLSGELRVPDIAHSLNQEC